MRALLCRTGGSARIAQPSAAAGPSRPASTRSISALGEARFALKRKRLAADTAYGAGAFVGWLVKEKRITPHIRVWEKSEREDGIFRPSQGADAEQRRSDQLQYPGCSEPGSARAFFDTIDQKPTRCT